MVGLVLLGLALPLALWSTLEWSQDHRAARESGPELGVPSLAPSPSESSTPIASVSPSPSTATATPLPAPTPERVPPGIPSRLTIRSIGVNALVVAVGKLSDGSQEVPDSMDETGWYEDGSKPGQPGNAVITGHTWSKGDGVFDRLPQLKEGVPITLTTSEGDQTYRVRSVGSIELEDFGSYAAEIYRTTGKSGLVLMTCGDWEASTRTYEATTVVYAEPVS